MKRIFSSTTSVHTRSLAFASVAASCLLQVAAASAAPTLTGWASLPATTTAPGPTAGQFAVTETSKAYLPIADAQSVQGFSGVLRGPTADSYYVMPDNGFGTKPSSADAVLRVYAVRPEFKVWSGRAVVGSGKVAPFQFNGRRALATFNKHAFIGLRDPDHKLGFKIQADFQNYYDNAANPPVDPAIIADRLLTGADFDIESVREDHDGNLWFGDEFGPFLITTDATGKVLRSEITLPNIKPSGSTSVGDFVQSPQNPFLLGADTNNLNASNGFEGMAINPDGDTLYTLLEGTVVGDAAKTLRINEFSIDDEKYTGKEWLYKLEALGTNIGDMTAVNAHQFIVIERNGNTATTVDAPFKRLYLIDIDKVDSFGYVSKTELVDLMNIADPHDLNGDSNTVFTFPYVTIEDVLILDDKTLLVINDNNFPGSGGRTTTAPDITEFLTIRLDEALEFEESCDGSRRDHAHGRGPDRKGGQR